MNIIDRWAEYFAFSALVLAVFVLTYLVCDAFGVW